MGWGIFFGLFLGSFVLGISIEAGLNRIASAIRERK